MRAVIPMHVLVKKYFFRNSKADDSEFQEKIVGRSLSSLLLSNNNSYMLCMEIVTAMKRIQRVKFNKSIVS